MHSQSWALCPGCPADIGPVYLPRTAASRSIVRLTSSRIGPVSRRQKAVVVAQDDGVISTGPDWWFNIEEDTDAEGEEEVKAIEEEYRELFDEDEEIEDGKQQAWRQQAHPSGEDYEEKYMTMEPEYQVPNPELGPLERRVSQGFLEALEDDEVSQEDANYWFTEPPGGWDQEPVTVEKVEGMVVTDWPLTAEHFGDDRIPLGNFKAGQVFEGEVAAALLYHGAKVDVGGEYDGMVPISAEQWKGVADKIPIGQKVKVKVWKVYEPDLFRWPIQMEFLEPDIQDKLIPAHAWEPPVDHRGKEMEEILERTGREYIVEKFFPPVDPTEMTEELTKGMDEDQEWDPREDEDYMEAMLHDIAELNSQMAVKKYGLSHGM